MCKILFRVGLYRQVVTMFAVYTHMLLHATLQVYIVELKSPQCLLSFFNLFDNLFFFFFLIEFKLQISNSFKGLVPIFLIGKLMPFFMLVLKE